MCRASVKAGLAHKGPFLFARLRMTSRDQNALASLPHFPRLASLLHTPALIFFLIFQRGLQHPALAVFPNTKIFDILMIAKKKSLTLAEPRFIIRQVFYE
jgi:hypothetical protein